MFECYCAILTPSSQLFHEIDTIINKEEISSISNTIRHVYYEIEID